PRTGKVRRHGGSVPESTAGMNTMPGGIESRRGTKPMEDVNLGRTGGVGARVALGGMSYGGPERGAHAWTLDEAASRPFFQRALELGITFFDTSNSYSDGTSEEITGRALRDFAKRDEVVLATKVFFPLRKDANARGLSRKA